MLKGVGSSRARRPRLARSASFIVLLVCALAVSAAAEGASKAAEKFFDAYRAQDVDAMVALFTEDATFEYVPFGEAGSGNVREDGAPVWRTLIQAFPDLRNEVNQIWVDESGEIAFVDVHIGGTQAEDAFGIENRGEDFWLRHLFVLETDEEGMITRITSFWDNATWYSQLGKTSLD